MKLLSWTVGVKKDYWGVEKSNMVVWKYTVVRPIYGMVRCFYCMQSDSIRLKTTPFESQTRREPEYTY